MAPLQENSIREQRLQDGCCPNCGTRLYKVTTANSGGGGGRVSKMFRKKNGSNNIKEGETSTNSKMTPLNIPGVVERGQCVKCGGGSGGGGHTGGGVATAIAAPVPTVKAIKIPPPAAFPPSGGGNQTDGGGKKPPPPQSKPEVQATMSNNQNTSNGGTANQCGDLKQPPEDLLGLNSVGKPPPPATTSSGNSQSSSSSGSEEDSSSSGSDSSSEYEDDDGSSLDIEDDLHPLLEMDLCRLESDHASSHVVNNLRSFNNIIDERKPAAKPSPSGRSSISHQIEESADRIRRLRDEATAVDMAILESTKTSNHQHEQGVGEGGKKLKCPSGMSPEVFDELPPEVQREILEQGAAASGISGTSAASAAAAQTNNAADIDPETLASLPVHIRKEVLEQARRDQQKQSGNTASTTPATSFAPTQLFPSKKKDKKVTERNSLSKSTAAFLSECDIDADDFEQFDEEIKNDIMKEKRRRSSVPLSASSSDDEEDNNKDLDQSTYDPETLASLPEDVRNEVLEEERRQREKKKEQRRQSANGRGSNCSSNSGIVGAHSVRNVPAGYDPDTFSALPEDVQQELLDDAAARRGSLPYTARVVQARPMNESGRGGGGTATSCTYTGEYNIMGKRHGDGELKWANDDKYVGKFKDGYIEGRGTISFHDGTEYTGQWRKNRFHGEGTRRFTNGNVYTGHYDSGTRQGQGRCYFANGDMYVGDWKQDTIHGFGRYYYNNGHSFEGMFRNGKRNGRGKYQLTDGRVEIYRYVNDARVGDGVRWSANRKKAWRMNDGKVTKRVSIDEAAAIAKRCGPLVEET
ncbi:hypothetical protein ACHAXR_013542 [Thalassiosira sp. AJA248-18]